MVSDFKYFTRIIVPSPVADNSTSQAKPTACIQSLFGIRSHSKIPGMLFYFFPFLFVLDCFELVEPPDFDSRCELDRRAEVKVELFQKSKHR